MDHYDINSTSEYEAPMAVGKTNKLNYELVRALYDAADAGESYTSGFSRLRDLGYNGGRKDTEEMFNNRKELLKIAEEAGPAHTEALELNEREIQLVYDISKELSQVTFENPRKTREVYRLCSSLDGLMPGDNSNGREQAAKQACDILELAETSNWEEYVERIKLLFPEAEDDE